jgi:serine/threonine-protein kinase
VKTPVDELLPIIVADLADAAARDFLVGLAASHGTVLVPLLGAPVDGGEHVLEVHVPDETEPTLFYASPVGPPSSDGSFPLCLRPFGQRATTEPRAESPSGQVAARRSTSHSLSEAHTRDLTSGAGAGRVEANVLGRTIASAKLEIEARIGGGSGGAVYRARHRDFRTVVAVKVLHDRAQRDLVFCARFHAEALAASRLDHVNLVRVLDFGQEPDGLMYLSMEHLDGMTLRALLEKERRLRAPRAIEIMLQVCAGLAHAHSRDVVHRDVKPSNIMLVSRKDDDGNVLEIVKVCDFGIALHRMEEGDSPAARVAGTPEYMSPEQCRGAGVDGRSDVYACGVMLYELLTGKVPLVGRDLADYQRLHLTATPKPPSAHLPDIDPRLEAILMKAIAKAPASRYASMLELRAALKELLVPAVPERGGRAAAALAGQGSNAKASVAPPPTSEGRRLREGEAMASELATSAATTLDAIASLRGRPEAFARTLATLEIAVRVLAARADSAALGAVVRMLVAIHNEPAPPGAEPPGAEPPGAEPPGAEPPGAVPAGAESPSALAQRVLRTIADPATLEPVAGKLLSGLTSSAEPALSLLAWAQVAGAHALYNARRKQGAALARTRFVSSMRLLGDAAAPLVRAALLHAWPRQEDPIEDVGLALDLLRCVPRTRDDAMGTLLARYARAPEPELVQVAVSALVHVWGERATPLLLASLQSLDDPVRVIALRGLMTLGGVDEFVVQKLEALLAGTARVSDELLLTAAEALSRSAPSAVAASARILLAAVTHPEGPVAAARGRGAPQAVILGFARAALLVAPREARPHVLARAAACAEPLRSQLLALV